MTTSLQTRVRRLEDATGAGGRGCDRCRGTLAVVEDAITGELKQARWNGEDISKGELHQRQTERECPRCGRKIDATEGIEIRVGGRFEAG